MIGVLRHTARLLVFAGLAVVCCVNELPAQGHPEPGTAVDAATTKKWRDDLAYMREELPKRHKNLFHKMSREEFAKAIKQLDGTSPR